jgi:2-polyprenyl-3-methyl-5-hydroxy-6-metoxy-1,4-benzoquinol methylase
MPINIQFRILKAICPASPDFRGENVYQGKSKLALLFGENFLGGISGKTVIDFGCGEGDDAVEMARRGARRVIGLEIREDLLQIARKKALAAGVPEICFFASSTNELAETVISLDAFEHFADPAEILRIMNALLQPAGEVFISFGPPWYHPLGGHLFSVFPWAHLIFSEKALIRWRSTFKTDGATRFSEVAGGLNQMTIKRFTGLIEGSDFELASLELVPLRKLQLFHNRLTREFTTAIVRCRLVKSGSPQTRNSSATP